MSSPFNAEFNSCDPGNGAHATVNAVFRGQPMSMDKLRRYANVFEKKVLKATIKKSRIPFKAKEKEETAEESQPNPIDALNVAFYPITSYPAPSNPSSPVPGGPVPDLSEPGQHAAGTNLSAYSTTCPDTSCISSLKNLVITFGFLSKLEAHVENCGNVIIVRWVANTKTSYLFMKEKLGLFGKNLQRRLNRKIATGAFYRKQMPKHRQ